MRIGARRPGHARRNSGAAAAIAGVLLLPALNARPAFSGQASSGPRPVLPAGPAPSATLQEPAAPASPPATGLQQAEVSGDWGGARTRWKDKGFVVDSSLTQFYQGVASGGTETGSEYNGTAQARLKFDFGKMAGWQFWSAEIKTEVRFGGPLLGGTGTINPVNTAAMIPGDDGTKFSITAVNVTRLFPVNLKEGKLVAVSFGRYNVLDLLDEDFFAGGGTERFFNIAQIGPLTVLRQVPLITTALNLAYIRGGEPFLTFSLMDPNDHSLDAGVSDMFADGVTFSPGVVFPAKYGGKTAKHSVGFAITTKEYTPFDAIRQVVIPGPPLVPMEPQGGSWSVNYVFRQYLVERGAKDGWGFFTQVSAADNATSPIATFFDAGLGGNGLFAGRPRDEFGISYAYTDLSDDLADNLNLITRGGRPVRAEHQFEFFYDVHLLPWLQLTGDLQIIRPTRSSAETAVVPGTRLRIVF